MRRASFRLSFMRLARKPNYRNSAERVVTFGPEILRARDFLRVSTFTLRTPALIEPMLVKAARERSMQRAADEGAAVVDANVDALAVDRVRDLHDRVEGERLVGGGEGVRAAASRRRPSSGLRCRSSPCTSGSGRSAGGRRSCQRPSHRRRRHHRSPSRPSCHHRRRRRRRRRSGPSSRASSRPPPGTARTRSPCRCRSGRCRSR